MASKWADYVITQVRYNIAKTHIEKVMAGLDNGDVLGEAKEVSRPSVVALLDEGVTFVTGIKSEPGKLTRGADVGIITVHGKKFIRTDADETEADNLDDLPTF